MKLYHGTTIPSAAKALEEGLLPSAKTGVSLWEKTVTSRPDAVYLTDTYPVYYAGHAVTHLPPEEDRRCAIIEIDGDKIDRYRLVPDEDALEQAYRGHDDLPVTGTEARTAWYRDNLERWAGTEVWRASLQVMGTCAVFDGVPAEAITRVALLDLCAMKMLGTYFIDLQPSVLGHPASRDQQKDQLHWLMEGDFPQEMEPISRMLLDHSRPYWQHRAWAEVMNADEARARLCPARAGINGPG